MLYMVVETYKPDCAAKVYERVRARGRMLPEGLTYINSWVDTRLETCFQLMESADEGLFDQWFQHWNDLVTFRVYPVCSGAEASRAAGEQH